MLPFSDNMSWVTVVWSMIVSACLTLACMHLFIWSRQRRAWGSLFLALSAVATSLLAVAEFWMMRSETTAQFASAVRWLHVPVWALMLSLIGFVRFYLRAGRPWLAWTVAGLRTLVLAINFIVTPNLNFREVTHLGHIFFLGESISVAQGTPGPWIWTGYATLALFVLFIADAFLTVWRRGDRRRALLICGSIALIGALGMTHSILVYWIALPIPFIGSWYYMGLILAMGYESSRDALRAAELARDLSDSEYRMTLAAETAHLGIWVRDGARNEIWASDHWRTLFGFGKSEPLEVSSLLQRVHPEDKETVQRALDNALADGGRHDIEYRLLPPDGQVRWIASRGGVTRSDGGKHARLHGVCLDITERKQAEERFRLAVEAQLKSEAETALQRNELAHLSRVTLMGELSASLAHELNQPLMAILSNAQAGLRFLEQKPGHIDEVQLILKDIVEDDKRAGEIIRRLRSLFRKGEVLHAPLDVSQVVRDVLKLVHNDLVNRKVTVTTELAAGLPMVEGDRIQLQQVMLNLVMNGRDAMESYSGERRLTLRTAATAGGDVEVSVEDRGPGIAPDDLERIFEPFISTKADGMGLGLAVCRTIVAAHHGRLWATNNADRGATLHFTLPAVGSPG